MNNALPSLDGSGYRRLVWTVALPIALFAAALLLRSTRLDYESSFDEMWFLELSNGYGSSHMTLPRNELITAAPQLNDLEHAPSVFSIPKSMGLVSHPPVYPMALRLWRSIVGPSPLTSRWFSVLASAFCVPLIFDSVRLLNGKAAAFWASLLLMLSATQITYAQEIRNYPLVECFMLCAINSVIRIERFGSSTLRVGALFIFGLLTLFTHYFAMPAVVALGVYTLIRFRGRQRVAAAGALIACGVVFAAWTPVILAQQHAINQQLTYWPVADEGRWWWALKIRRFFMGPLRLLFEPMQSSQNVALASGALILVMPWLCLKRLPQLLLWILVLDSVLGTIFLYDMICRTNQMSEVRHEVMAAIGLCAIIPVMAGMFKGVLRQAMPAVVALACIPSITLRHEPNFEHFSALARLASDARYSSEPILFFGKEPYLWWADVMYLGVSTYSKTFPRPVIRADRPLDPALVAKLKRWPGAVLIYEAGNGPPEQIVPGSIAQPIGTEAFLASVTHLTWESASTQPAR